MDPLSAGLSFGGGLAATAANIWMNERNNDRQEAFAREMYTNQRMDANYDWFRTNQYNSPAEQMNRLRQAGLNPNLVYGKGADNTAAMVRSSTAAQPNFAPSKVDPAMVSTALQLGADLKLKQAQTDNISEQTALNKKEQLIKELDAANRSIKNAKDQWEFDLAKENKDVIQTRMRLENQNQVEDIFTKQIGQASTIQGMQIALDRNEREQLKNASDIQVAAQSIINSRIANAKTSQEIENLKAQKKIIDSEGIIKQADAALKQYNINPSDPIYWRLLMLGAKKIDDAKNSSDKEYWDNWFEKHPNINKK